MKNLFTPNRLLMLFGLALLVVWIALQYVSNSLIAAVAERDSTSILNWYWPNKHIRSVANSIETQVLSRSGTDARVKVTAKQLIGKTSEAGVLLDAASKPIDCKLILAYYHSNQHWVLGRVELP